MLGKKIYKIWAPSGEKWVDWIRPVPFIGIDNHSKSQEFLDFTIPNINYIDKLQEDTAIIIDLPGYTSIKEGIALSKRGYRLIPIFNGTNEQEGASSTVDNHSIETGLIWGASELENIELSNNAPPAFLLDCNRMHRFKMSPAVFDNSWDIYPQDIPSAEYFLNNGIHKILIRGQNDIQKDLNKILYKYQKQGIKIIFTDGYNEPKEIKLKKPIKEKKE